MKNILKCIVLIGFFWNSAFAQESEIEYLQQLDIREIEGVVPRNYEELVRASTLIVKGRYGNLIGNQKFYGYNRTKKSFQEQFDLSDAQVERIGLPLSEYEIVVDEVLKGDLDNENIVYRVYETYPKEGDRLLDAQSKERLFFLTPNPDNITYSVPGIRFILTNDFGNYRYRDPSQPWDRIGYIDLEWADSSEAQHVEDKISQEIARQSID